MKKKLFTLYDSIPWIPCLALVAVTVYALFSNLFKGELKLIEGIVFGTVALVFLGAIVGHYVVRYDMVKKWNNAPKLWDKVAIFNSSTSSMTYLLSIIEKDEALKALLDKWVWWGTSDRGVPLLESIKKVDKSVAGCNLYIFEEPIKVGFFKGLLAGLQDGVNIEVVGPNKADPNMFNGPGRFLALIGHETSHRICGEAFKVPYGPLGENHHKLFAQTKICS